MEYLQQAKTSKDALFIELLFLQIICCLYLRLLNVSLRSLISLYYEKTLLNIEFCLAEIFKDEYLLYVSNGDQSKYKFKGSS